MATMPSRSRGRPEGEALVHWLGAEAELAAEAAAVPNPIRQGARRRRGRRKNRLVGLRKGAGWKFAL